MDINKNIIELLKDLNYNNIYKDYIIKILIELSFNKNVIFYKTILPYSLNKNKLLTIKYPIKIKLKGNLYKISLNLFGFGLSGKTTGNFY